MNLVALWMFVRSTILDEWFKCKRTIPPNVQIGWLKRSVEITRIYSHTLFNKNFVKATFSIQQTQWGNDYYNTITIFIEKSTFFCQIKSPFWIMKTLKSWIHNIFMMRVNFTFFHIVNSVEKPNTYTITWKNVLWNQIID